ncbi:hypothetical protein KSS87_015542 [Heliosperma pusillum]|nr:hypothetical protein KSS87_015542 [Heliosperma pusillum]
MKSRPNQNNDVGPAIKFGLAGLVTGAVLMLAFLKAGNINGQSQLIALSSTHKKVVDISSATSIQQAAILHYATSKVTPQQTLDQINVSHTVLRTLAPCNFLVFGLGYDSLMWAAFNPGGTTLFLEEHEQWVQKVLKIAPSLHAKTVSYRTHLHEADELLSSYKSEPQCLPNNAYLKGNKKCRLALDTLPEEVYEREWDVIMIDAPMGYFKEAPGRMSAIYSAAVMARARTGVGSTHVFVHDADRKVEKSFAREFLCSKYLVGGSGRLWHFEIPHGSENDGGNSFC